ncbi:hypothetical protein SAMN05444422_101241 [Halobiforma haloterrestris]|uniref:RecA-superfamily ATPase, KaiC/GvpD/RAD55 family n=1 Tax=Natronobacterium haloterrestre TaxID=148448 RepID=A0A1I1D4Q4_NATHA|nr:hypothetical protein [Halobiforma haloterrestris]SFB69352.1 hypothetical protein SAMN05444422_101241 [Halobiforma haloterrestris]
MSLASAEPFAVEGVSVDGLEDGTSILLTGSDTDALEAVFARLVAPDSAADERSVVLETERGARSLGRTLDDARPGAADDVSVLLSDDAGRGTNADAVADVADLTTLGMELSTLIATTQQSTERFRSGIFLCSTICREVDDVRSIYRFLNTNFLTELRRGTGIGVCALDTSADLETDIDSMISGMETSFTGRIDVEKTGRREATLTTSGLSGVGVDEEVIVSL